MASKRRLRRNKCGNKQRHKSYSEAYSQICSLKRSGKYYGYLTAYSCSFCSFWHIGHSAKAKTAG